ncbi:hypothetical protein DEU56DRAFT_355399 [Suillus clintonianus]|uniref:uncharacterized protein n=1 Tax=Suillus clintonianus TaxID=1904413 RepID=UPI001B85B91D|nr:uncharacterized protein DEU56DRAFT_355399 [Suillus clintonianus]KAG2137088.1 hypothetical protein DEU56DRAFT_355399 [Suillus clintonianus]
MAWLSAGQSRMMCNLFLASSNILICDCALQIPGALLTAPTKTYWFIVTRTGCVERSFLNKCTMSVFLHLHSLRSAISSDSVPFYFSISLYRVVNATLPSNVDLLLTSRSI